MGDQYAEKSSLEAGRYAAVLRRRWPVVLAFLVLGLLASYLYAQSRPTEATATAAVQIEPIRSDSFLAQRSASGLIDPTTEEQLARSSYVLSHTALSLGGRTTIADVRGNSAVNVVANATVVDLSYTAPRMSDALRGANALAQAYLDYRSSEAAARVSRVVASMNKNADAIRADLVKVNAVLNSAAPRSRQSAQAISDRQILTARLNTVLQQTAQFQGTDTSGGSLVTSAEDNPVAFAPHKRMLIEIGTAFGLLLGLIAAFLVDVLDRRVQDEPSLARLGAGSVLATMGRGDGTLPLSGRDLDEIQSAAEQVKAALPPDEPVLAVADLSPEKRPSDVPLALALCLAQDDREVDVLLNDPDGGVARLLVHRFGAEPSSRALSGVPGQMFTLRPDARVPGGVRGQETGARRSTDHRPTVGAAHLTVILLGPDAPRSSVLASARLSSLAVLVVGRRRTRPASVRQAVARFESLGTLVLGAILVSGRRRPAMTEDAEVREPVASESRG